MPTGNHTFGRILAESFKLYLMHGWPFTRPLLLPMAMIILGLYGCIGLTSLYLKAMEPYLDGPLSIILVLLGFFLIFCVTFLVLKTGFLQYIFYIVSLCNNTAQVLQGEKPDFKAAYQEIFKTKLKPYAMLLTGYFIPSLIALLPPVLAIMLAALFQTPAVTILLIAVGFLASLALGAAWVIYVFFLTYIFQITAFESVPLNPLPTFRESAVMTWQAPFKTFFMQVLLLLLTSYIIPCPLVWLLRAMNLTYPLDLLHRSFTGGLLQGLAPEAGWGEMVDSYDMIYPIIQEFFQHLPAMLTDSLLGAVITSLLLPLGTFAFTLLYFDIKVRQKTVQAGT